MIDVELKRQLLGMAEEDQRVRAELAATGELWQGYAPRMAEVHLRNAEALERIVDTSGWPERSRVGEDGARAAWLVLQHAIGSPGLMRKCLPLLEDAVERGEAEAQEVAYLSDRISSFEGRPQRYGTQFDWDENGEMSPRPVDDPAEVDRRRAALGLPPLAEQIATMRESMAATGAQPPADYGERQREIREWAKSVGW